MKIVMILADHLRGVLSIRAMQAETEHIFESFRPGGKELITHGCPFRCMIKPAGREPRPRRRRCQSKFSGCPGCVSLGT
jgi:hypothetical protein